MARRTTPRTTTAVSLLQGVNHGNGRAVVSFRYGTTTALTADARTPLFGHAVTILLADPRVDHW
ncbi:hypothetical protein BX265_7598 [Streptomyces sp. TLI_235]|nr:hypothetical protein [Streptomyces sp. TLI_235]PBC70202.1 hypothetical protein BX265_7598 [Streptomyces sp. TLI_235]